MRIQQTETLQVRNSQRSVIDAYVQWTVDRNLSSRLGLANLGALDTLNQTYVESAAGPQLSKTQQRSFTSWTLRAELRP
jgi:hypothetical protein